MRQMSQGGEKFKCIEDCGECCRNLRGNLNKSRLPEYLSKIKQLSRTIGIYYLTIPARMTILLLDWEARQLDRMAEKMGIVFRYTPFMAAKDSRSDRVLVLVWNMDHDDCPFLDERSRCKVYDDRPLHCMSFPISTVGNRIRSLGEGLCPAITSLDELGGKASPRQVDKIYPGCAKAAVGLNGAVSTIVDIFSESALTGEFSPVVGESHRIIRKEVNQGIELIGFVEWMSKQTGESIEVVERSLREASYPFPNS